MFHFSMAVCGTLSHVFILCSCDLTTLNTGRKKSRMLVTPVFLAVQPMWSYAYFYLRILYIQVDRICYNKYLLKLRQISALWLSSARLRLQPAPRHTWELLQHLLLIDLSWKVNSFPVVWIMFECWCSCSIPRKVFQWGLAFINMSAGMWAIKAQPPAAILLCPRRGWAAVHCQADRGTETEISCHGLEGTQFD